MELKTECIKCYKRYDFTENICQDCLNKLHEKEEELKELERRVEKIRNLNYELMSTLTWRKLNAREKEQLRISREIKQTLENKND